MKISIDELACVATRMEWSDKYLERVIDAILAVKKNNKIENALRSTKIRNPNANKGGRPKKRKDEIIREKRKQGLTMREIAQQTGHSLMQVQRALK